MKSAPTQEHEIAADRMARQITARLDEGQAWLPYEVTERLRASREQAVAQRRREVAVLQPQTAASPVILHGGTLAMGGGSNDSGSWWRAMLSAVPILALVAGLVVINTQSDQFGLKEAAEVDTALLTDDLPPAAYADPGFIQYLKTSAPGTER